jgi:hypothetical protein
MNAALDEKAKIRAFFHNGNFSDLRSVVQRTYVRGISGLTCQMELDGIKVGYARATVPGCPGTWHHGLGPGTEGTHVSAGPNSSREKPAGAIG